MPTPNTQTGETQNQPSCDLLTRVDDAIRKSRHLSGSHVFIHEESGIVMLHGKVGSFFQKQMAQETLKRLQGVERIVNELEVDWRSSVSDTYC